MSWLECALETVRLGLEDLKAAVERKKRPEFWERLWVAYVQSKVDWRLSKTEHASRYRQCGQDMRDLLQWIDRNDPKLSEREAVKLLRRVFEEQFEVVGGKLELTTKRPCGAVQNPHDPDAHYADKGTKQWIGYKVHVVESVDPQRPIEKKGEPAEHFITEILRTEAAQDEMAGLTETLKREQHHHEITPQAMYADAGYVTENTLTQAEQTGMELLGPTRPHPHKGAYNTDAFHVDIDKRQAVCPQGNLSSHAAALKITTCEPSTTELNGPVNATAVLYKSSVRVPRVDGELWSWGCATIWCRNAENKCARRGSRKQCSREMASRQPTASWCVGTG